MGGPVRVHGRTVVTSKSEGVSFAMGDVCKLSDGAPVPFVNVAFSADAADTAGTVRVNGVPVVLAGSRFSKSTGDEPGEKGGLISGTTQGPARFTNYAFEVRFEGQGVPRALDPMVHNLDGTGVPNAASPAELQAAGTESDQEILCAVVCFCAFGASEGGKTSCVRNVLATPSWRNGQRTWDPRPGPLTAYVEVPYYLGPPVRVAMSSVPSAWLTDPKGAPLPLPRGDEPPRRGTVRPDIVVVKDPTKPPTPDNIKDVYEVKFPPDKLGKTQAKNYAKITGREPIELSPEICGCTGDEPPPPVPIPVPQREPQKQEDPRPIPIHDPPLEPIGVIGTLGVLVVALWQVVKAIPKLAPQPIILVPGTLPGGEPLKET